MVDQRGPDTTWTRPINGVGLFLRGHTVYTAYPSYDRVAVPHDRPVPNDHQSHLHCATEDALGNLTG